MTTLTKLTAQSALLAGRLLEARMDQDRIEQRVKDLEADFRKVEGKIREEQGA